MDAMTKAARYCASCCLLLAVVVGNAYLYSQTHAATNGDLDYFKDVWTISVKGLPKLSIRWTVRSEPSDAWLRGTVETDGKLSSSDIWRINRGRIERYASTSDGLFVAISSDGWRTGKLLFTGTASGKDGEYNVRETITRENERKFSAVWERQTPEGAWSIFSNETCSK